MTNVTVAALLNDKVLRDDFPKMTDEAFKHAIHLAAFVGQDMQPEPEDEIGEALKEYYLSFQAMRRVLPRSVLISLAVVGVKALDFMSLITEVSGLHVVQTNDGLWFFDMRRPKPTDLLEGMFAEPYARVTPESTIPQFWSEPGDDEGDYEEDEDEVGRW